MSSTINALTSGGGGIAVGGDSSGQIALQKDGTTYATGNQYGIGLGTAVPSSGIGITFPATQSASTDANTLDDYEEGTFTPTVAGSSTAGTTTYGEQGGYYTKIGRQVTVQFFVGISNMTGTGGAIEFGNFPFTSNSSAGRAVGTAMTDSLTYPTANSSAVFYVANSGNYGRIFVCANNTAWAVVAPDTAFTVYGTVTYFV